MPGIELFPDEQIVGVFRGFQEGGLEFHADLVLPYRNEFQSIPMHGQFLLVQLETSDEAVLGRIASLSSGGKLTSSAGEEFNIRAINDHRVVPEDLREQYLRYRVSMRVLGVLRANIDEPPTFIASHRRLPHVGSPVAFPSPEVLKEIAGHNVEGAELGHFALGEYVYARGSQRFQPETWTQVKTPEVLVRFPVENLVSRRSFVFARAGFGKSNLNKLLFSKLYESTPTVTKRAGRQVPVGTVIFDPDGEYFWPDDKGRPGLCDVPALADKLVVFTSRQGPSPFYQSFVAGKVKLDIRRLNAGDVIAIGLSPDRQDQQNVRKLRGLDQGRWAQLVDLIDRHRHATPERDIAQILNLEQDRQQMEALAARSNMVGIVQMLHDKSSQLMDVLLRALAEGKLCIIDTSQMRGGQSLVLAGLILRRIFDRNQQEFTKAESATIPTIAVIEEAQSVLNEKTTASEPFVTWVKEGRKYDLGAVLITQQPGSIPQELLSQGDNWFIFHLLSSGDLMRVKQANAHFSDDLLSSLLNEPIPGHGVFWSSASGKPYPVSVRVLSFEHSYPLRDPLYQRDAAPTYASQLKAEFDSSLKEAVEADQQTRLEIGAVAANGNRPDQMSFVEQDPGEPDIDGDPVDPFELYKRGAVRALETDRNLNLKLKGDGAPWGALGAFLRDQLPETLDDRDSLGFQLVRPALDEILGQQGVAWHTFRKGDRNTLYVKIGRDESISGES